jgi:hypothetical protein
MGQSYKKWMQGALAGALTAWVAGCAAPTDTTTREAPAPPANTQATPVQSPPQRPSAADKRFVIAPELLGVLHVVRVLLDNQPGAYLKIQVTVQNLTDARQQFRYRVDWFNNYGDRLQFGIESFTPWMLMPHEISSIAVTAPSPTAADCGIAFVPAVK